MNLNLNHFINDMNEICIAATQTIDRMLKAKISVKDVAEHLGIADHWVVNVRGSHSIVDPRMACKILVNADKPFKPEVDAKILKDTAEKPWDKLPIKK
jgi:hypothetical protein